MTLPRPFFIANAVALGFLDSGEIESLTKRLASCAKSATLQGGTTTSLELHGTETRYGLIDGHGVVEQFPQLVDLYQGPFRSLAERVWGRQLVPSPDVVSGINVNVLLDVDHRYEWHVDSNSVTGLLVLSRCSADSGGRLLFGYDPAERTELSFVPGDLMFFDARNVPHAVEPMRAGLPRVSLPMNYFFADEPIYRPDDLDSALYGDPDPLP